MLEIYVRGHEQPLMVRERLEALLHDVRVIQGVPFLSLEDSDADLVNLNDVWRMVEATEVDTERTGEGNGTAPELCEHGYVMGTCSVCRAVADVEAQQLYVES